MGLAVFGVAAYSIASKKDFAKTSYGLKSILFVGDYFGFGFLDFKDVRRAIFLEPSFADSHYSRIAPFSLKNSQHKNQ